MQSVDNYAGYFDMASDAMKMTGIVVFIRVLFIAMAIVAIVGCSISLYHALKEEKRRTECIVFSSIGLGCSILGLFIFIFAIAGYVFLIISLAKDDKNRGLFRYIVIPILVSAVIAVGYTVLMDKMIGFYQEEFETQQEQLQEEIGIYDGTIPEFGQTSEENNSGDDDLNTGVSVTNESERIIRETLKDDVDKMNGYLAEINAYGNDLRNMGVRVPELPEYISGDQFSYLDDSESTLVYTPNYIFSNGVDYDWYEKTIENGNRFLPYLAENDDWYQYLMELKSQQDYPDYSFDKWTLLDGTEIDLNEETADATLRESILNYTMAVDSYIATKYRYQTVDLVDYLYYEYNLSN